MVYILFRYDPYHLYRQPGSAMGEAGRDPPVSVHLGTITEGSNEVYMHCHDERALSMVMRLVVRRSLNEVKSMIPAPASFPLAKAMLELKMRGRNKEETDTDIIIKDSLILSLRCPISGMICKTPARTRQCLSLAVFDLDTFIELNAKVRKWTCPHCGVTGRPHDIIIDGYLARVLGVLRARERQTRENATERIEIESSGRWRPVMTNPLEGKTDARWICAETMLGVVLGTGGSVLHVPQELVETDDSVRIAGNCMGGKLTDKLEGHGEAVGDDKGRDGAICQVRVQRELSKDVLSPSSPEVIVISESDDDDAQKGTVSYDQPFTATFLPLGIIDKEKISP